MGYPERVADVVERVVVDVAEGLLGGVEGFDQRGRTITDAAHARLDDLPALVVAGGGWLGVQDGHVPSLQIRNAKGAQTVGRSRRTGAI